MPDTINAGRRADEFLVKRSKQPDLRPLIGITMRHELETERFYLARAYSEAVEAAGGVPVHLSLIPNRLIGTGDGHADGCSYRAETRMLTR